MTIFALHIINLTDSMKKKLKIKIKKEYNQETKDKKRKIGQNKKDLSKWFKWFQIIFS